VARPAATGGAPRSEATKTSPTGGRP
jgi:hypothetical protein